MFDNLDSTLIKESNEEDLLAAAGVQKKEIKPDPNNGGSANGGDDDDDLDNPGDQQPEKKKPADKKKPAPKSKNDKTDIQKEVTDLSDDDLKQALGEDNDDDEPNDDDDDDDKDDKDDNKSNDDEQELTEEEISTSDFLKARVKFLIEKGEWAPLDESVDIDEVIWTEDNFADLELKQREAQREEMKKDILSSFGAIGATLAEYSSQGGNPEKLIEIFKEQQFVELIAIDTEDGQKSAVYKYQTEFLNKSPESANRFIKNLLADNELEAEAKEVKGLMEQELQDQLEAEKQEQADRDAQRIERENKTIKDFSDSVISHVDKSTDIPADEKKELIKVLTKFDKKLANGTKVNEFYFKFANFRKDLPNYLKLVRLVLNPAKYDKSLLNQGKTTEAQKAFKIIKSVNSSKKSVSTDPSGTGKSKSGFKLLY